MEKLKMRRETAILLGIYVLVWAVALLVYHLLMGPADGMDFWLVFLIGVLPFAEVVLSFLLGKMDCGGQRKWLFAIFFGVMYMLAEYLTFGLSNMLNQHHWVEPQWNMGTKGILLSLLGLVIGDWLRRSGAARRR